MPSANSQLSFDTGKPSTKEFIDMTINHLENDNVFVVFDWADASLNN